MAVYAMSDLHLALDNPDKTMEVFGSGWDDYINRIEVGSRIVGDEDLFLLPGDLSWCTYLKSGVKDFTFINSLPGHKLIIRGNHDYWWGTLNKMTEQFEAMGFDSCEILKNTAYVGPEAVVSGTRGWKLLTDNDLTADDIKIHNREFGRLETVVKAINDADPEHKLPHILMMHYPPLTKDFTDTDYEEIISSSGTVDICIYGHLHGRAHAKIFEGENRGVKYFCVAADYLKFKPLRVL